MRLLSKRALFLQGFSHRYYLGLVNAQKRDCRSARRSTCFQAWSIPDKVFRPGITPGMEQANDFAVVRIDSSNVRPLEAIAVDAGKGQIIRYGWSAMLLGDDVIDLEWRGM